MRERLTFEQEVGRLSALAEMPRWQRETDQELRAKFRYLSLLPHRIMRDGKDVPLEPASADPGIYDGPSAYKVAKPLQACLMQVMRQRKFAHLRVALVDLSGGKLLAPEFAGYNHKDQVFVASVAKIGAMLAAFQLEHDLQSATTSGKFADMGALFARIRDEWAATQADPGGKAEPLGGRLGRRGSLILSGGSKVGFSGTATRRWKEKGVPKVETKPVTVPKLPRLEAIVEPVAQGSSFVPSLIRSKETPHDLVVLADRFNKQRDNADAIGKLGMIQRVAIAAGGDVPISNFVVSTVIGDLGFGYIVSVLLQSGLFDSQRNGGLWLGRDYWRLAWSGLPVNGQSATAGSLAAFLVLLAQDRLVSPSASAMMRRMLKKPPQLAPATGSWFKSAFTSQPPHKLYAKVGLAAGADEVALIERNVEADVADPATGNTARRTLALRYVVVALRAQNAEELVSLVSALDGCIQLNNGAKPGPL